MYFKNSSYGDSSILLTLTQQGGESILSYSFSSNVEQVIDTDTTYYTVSSSDTSAYLYIQCI